MQIKSRMAVVCSLIGQDGKMTCDWPSTIAIQTNKLYIRSVPLPKIAEVMQWMGKAAHDVGTFDLLVVIGRRP